jgi:predicted ATPase
VNLCWEPRGVNLLVGPNNAGKTNLCHALRFLAATAREDSLDEAARRAGMQRTEMLFRGAEEEQVELEVVAELEADGEPWTYTYELTLEATKPTEPGVFALGVREERLTAVGAEARIELIRRERDQVALAHETRWLARETDAYVRTTAPPRGRSRLPAASGARARARARRAVIALRTTEPRRAGDADRGPIWAQVQPTVAV